MICGLCHWRGTRPNKSGLWCNCDMSGRKKIQAGDQECDCFNLDPKVLDLLQQAPHMELENMRLWDVVLNQCSALSSTERVVLYHMRISQNIKRLLDLMDRCQVVEGTSLLVGPIPQLQEAHHRLKVHLKETEMKYPTTEEVEAADRIQLARWSRFLNSPGASAIGTPEFNERLDKESKILTRILERFDELGGMTPEISKEIG